MLAIPVIYWLAGGSAFIFTFGCLAVEWLRDESSRGRIMTTGLSILIMGLCLFTAKVILPQYPFARLIYGADFFRFPKTYPSGVWVMWLFCLVVPLSHLMLPAVFKKTRNLALAVIVTLIAVAGPGAYMISINTDTAKEDIMAYDHYVRMQQWDKAIARADRKAPSSPLSVATRQADVSGCTFTIQPGGNAALAVDTITWLPGPWRNRHRPGRDRPAAAMLVLARTRQSSLRHRKRSFPPRLRHQRQTNRSRSCHRQKRSLPTRHPGSLE